MRLAAIAALVGLVVSPLFAQDSVDISRRALGIERSVMSPFCPGKTLDGCPSPRAGEWRAEIRGWVAQGMSNAEIFDRLQARVPGFDLSGRPQGNADWAIPTGAAVFATLVLLWFARRWRPGDEDEVLTGNTAYDAVLDEELARLD